MGNRARETLIQSGKMAPSGAPPSVVQAQLATVRRDDVDDSLAGAVTDVPEVVLAEVDKKVRHLKNCALWDRGDDEVKAAFDLWFTKRGGNAADIDITKKRQAAGEYTAGIGGAAVGRGAIDKSALDLPLGMTGEQYRALAELRAFIGADIRVAGAVRARLGDSVYAQLTGKLHVFGGALAAAKGRAGFTMVDGIPYPVGFDLGGSVEAFAGIKGSTDGELTISTVGGQLGIGVVGGGSIGGMAGAEAKASGELVVDPMRGRFSIQGDAGVFAGVKAEGRVSGGANLYTRKLFRVGVTGSTQAGAGGNVLSQFSLRGGLIKVKFQCDATLGFGFGGGGDVEADVKPLWVLVRRTRAQLKWRNSSSLEHHFDDYRTVFNRVIRPKLEAYRDFKLGQLRMGEAANYVKMEKVQAIIDENWPRPVIKQYVGKDNDRASMNSALHALIKDVFEDIHGYKGDVPVKVLPTGRNCFLRTLQLEPRDLPNLLGGAVEAGHTAGTNTGAARPLTAVGSS